MSDLSSLAAAVAAELGLGVADLEPIIAGLTRGLAAAMVPEQDKPRTKGPAFVGRRLARVTVVNAGPPLTADVEVGTGADAVTIPGVSPQSTYRPQVNDLVWLEIVGTDSQISAPVTTDANRKWTALSLAGAWANVGTPLGYWRDPLGIVHLRGSVGGGALPSTIATLPSGYRPPSFYGWACPLPTAGQSAQVNIDPTTGAIQYNQGTAAPATLHLEGIQFRVD